MNTKLDINAVLRKIREVFGSLKKPDRIVTECDYDDKERDQIEKHFQGMDRNAMSSYDVSMMLIDGALIEPKSYLYFLPRLAKDVFYADADIYFLKARMDDLLDIDGLTYDQKNVLEQLKELLHYFEKQSEE